MNIPKIIIGIILILVGIGLFIFVSYGFLILIIYAIIIFSLCASYEIYKENNQKIDFGGAFLYFAVTFAFVTTFLLIFISVFYNELYVRIVKTFPDWSLIIALFSFSSAIIYALQGKLSTKKGMDDIQTKLHDIESLLKNKKEESMPEEPLEIPGKKQNAEEQKLNPSKEFKRVILTENIKKNMVFYGFPFILAVAFFYPFINNSAPDLDDTLKGIYSIYITISTIILSVSFVVISIIPIYFQRERNERRLEPGPMITGNTRYPLHSLYITSLNHKVLVYSFMGILLSLISYIQMASHTLSDLPLKLLFLITTFFVIGSLLVLALLTGELQTNMIRSFIS